MSLLQNPDKQSSECGTQGSPTPPPAKQQGYIFMISISVFTLDYRLCYTSFEYFMHSLLPVQYPSLHVGLKLGQSSSLVHSMKKCLETYEKLVYGKILIHKNGDS